MTLIISFLVVWCSATDQAQQWNSVVRIETAAVQPNYLRPWEMSSQTRMGGSGFVVDGDRILTNYHVVEDAVDIRLSKTGHFKRWSARVAAIGPDVDLATLEVIEDADAFFSDLVPITWSDELASLRSRVTVRGYPLGGTGLSVTEGVISRIESKNYRLGPTSNMLPGTLLVIQIDAAINGGNSGGPAFDASDRVVGVAFQGIDNAQNIGYLIPASLARTVSRCEP
jgi:S1-C subfamily serine protease